VAKVGIAQQRPAVHGEKMIEVKVRFWTDDIADEGHIIPKRGWAAGVVRMKSNESHGIVPLKPVPFNSIAEIPSVMEAVLIAHGIELLPSPKMRKYMPE
jgi:hypothetical protein